MMDRKGFLHVHGLYVFVCVITINLRDIFTAPCIMILRREIHITWVIVIVVLKVQPVLGPGIA